MKTKLMAMLLAAGAMLGAWAYNVSLVKGTEDAANWTISPTEAEPGAQVTVTYTGEKTIKSVTAKKVAAAEPVSRATPLTMEALTDGTIKVNIIDGTLSTGMKYSVNGGAKTLIYTTTTINVTTGDKVQFYGNGTSTQVYGGSPEVKLLGTAQTKVYGNIMSLIDEADYETATTLPSQEFVFYGLFYGNTTLTDASGLLLPATTLAKGCYSFMFGVCTALAAAPQLPAITLAEDCYKSMFKYCSILTAAPALPASTLAYGCYRDMFCDCTSLSSVTCLATSGISTDFSTDNWLDNVAASGTFFADSTATWPDGVGGIPTGWTRQDASKVEIIPTANANEWTFVTPPFDVELEVVYYSDQDFADVVIATIAAIGDVAYTDVKDPYVATKAVTLSGAVYDGNAVVGIVELKLGKVSKGKSKVSGSVTTLDGKKHSAKGVAVTGIDGNAPATVSLEVKGLGTLAVTIGGEQFAGSLGGTYHVQTADVGGAWAGGSAVAAVEPGDLTVFAGTVLSDFLPTNEVAAVSGGKWSFAKAASVKWAKPKGASEKELVVDTSKGKNLSGLKLTYTPKKGTFKGSFNVYALEGSGSATKLKKYKLSVNGVVVGGIGYGVATSKKPAISWPMTVE